MLARNFGPSRVLLEIACAALRVAYRSELPGAQTAANRAPAVQILTGRLFLNLTIHETRGAVPSMGA